MRKRALITLSVVGIAILLFATSGAVERTKPFWSCADGLSILATIDSDELSWNPWSSHMYLIRPSVARWLLRNFDWPYQCTTNMPVIHSVLAARGTVSEDANSFLLELLQLIARRDDQIETEHHGYTPLHTAIQFCDITAVELLLDAGADVTATIERPGGSAHGLNAIEFSALLRERDPSGTYPNCRNEIVAALSED